MVGRGRRQECLFRLHNHSLRRRLLPPLRCRFRLQPLLGGKKGRQRKCPPQLLHSSLLHPCCRRSSFLWYPLLQQLWYIAIDSLSFGPNQFCLSCRIIQSKKKFVAIVPFVICIGMLWHARICVPHLCFVCATLIFYLFGGIRCCKFANRKGFNICKSSESITHLAPNCCW